MRMCTHRQMRTRASHMCLCVCVSVCVCVHARTCIERAGKEGEEGSSVVG